MPLYTKEAIKICSPQETVARCKNIFNNLNLEKFGIIEYNFRNNEQFGVWAANLFINHNLLYQYYNNQFPEIKNIKNFWFKKVSGKGISYEQCSASLFMEFFERISIELKIGQLKENITKKSIKDYLQYLKETDTIFFNHFNYIYEKNNKEEPIPLIETIDIISNNKILFPLNLLFFASNGYTAGNEKKEAIVHGIFEIVERFTQTIFLIKILNITKEDLILKKDDIIYGYDENLINYINLINPKKININSIIKHLPDLEEIISNISSNFNLFEIIDISITLNGVTFYSYIVYQYEEKTNFKLFASGGAHFDQRIALIRALTEATQGYVPFEKLNQSWNGYLFTKKFIDSVIDYEFIEENFILDNKKYESMDEIYNEIIKPFKSIIILDCTNQNFNIPVFSIYIPEFYSKSFLWSNIFSTSQIGEKDIIDLLGEDNISDLKGNLFEKSIDGLSHLYFLEYNKDFDENIRVKLYDLYLSYLKDDKLIDYIIENEENPERINRIKKLNSDKKNPKIGTLLSLDKKESNSFINFYLLLSKNNKNDKDFSRICDIYSKIGYIDYALKFANMNNINISEIINEYLPKYIQFADYILKYNLLNRYIELIKKIYFITNDKKYLETIEYYKTIISKNDILYQNLNKIKTNNQNLNIEKIFKKNEYSIKIIINNIEIEILSFNDKSKINYKTKNNYFLKYNVNFFEFNKRKTIKELISRILTF